MISGLISNPVAEVAVGTGGTAAANALLETFRRDSLVDADAQYNRAHNHALEHHRDDVVGEALREATSGPDADFTADDLAALDAAADNGTESGHDEGIQVGRVPSREEPSDD